MHYVYENGTERDTHVPKGSPRTMISARPASLRTSTTRRTTINTHYRWRLLDHKEVGLSREGKIMLLLGALPARSR